MSLTDFVRKPRWALRQLLPLHYRTYYTETATGQRHFCVWRMWLGRSFAIDDVWVIRGVEETR